MNVDTSILPDLKFIFYKIESAFEMLREELFALEFVSAEVYKLPVVEEGKDELPTPTIDIEKITGKRAFLLASGAFRRVERDLGHSKRSVYRLPGYIHLKGNREGIERSLQEIATLKESFKTTAMTIKNGELRAKTIHDVRKTIVTKQLYRQLHLVEHDVERISFCWGKRDIIRKEDRNKLIEKLKSQMNNNPSSKISDEQWKHMVTTEIDNVRRLPENIELRTKRQAKVQPLVNTKGSNGSDVNKAQLSGHLPIIVIQDMPMKVFSLYDYNELRERCTRSDLRISSEPLIERLHIHTIRSPN